MFYVVDNMERTVIMHSKYASKDDSFVKLVKKKSYLEIEGGFDPHYGYIILLIKYNSISKDVIINADGMLEVKISVQVICQIPTPGEIVDAVVKSVSKPSIIAIFCGLIHCTIKASEFAEDDYVYMKLERKEGEGPKAYFHLNSDPLKDIKIGSVVRIKIVERMIGSKGYFCTGTMNDGSNNYLGIRINPPPIPPVEDDD